MRKIVLLLTLLYSLQSIAQSRITWAAPEAVAGKTYGNLHPRIALNRYNAPMVIWGTVEGKLYFSKDSNGTFSTPQMLNQEPSRIFAETWAGPSIASQDNNVYIVYQCEHIGDNLGKNQNSDTLDFKSLDTQNCNHVFIRHSYDGGNTFSIAEQVDHTKSNTGKLPSVCTDDDGNPIVAYLQCNADNSVVRLAVARSYDRGETFTHDTVLNDVNARLVSDCISPAITSLGDNAALVYRNNIKNYRNAWAQVSTNKGFSFSKNVRLDSLNFVAENCPASATSGIINGDTLYSVFMSGEDNASIVYLSMLSLSDSSYPVTTALYPASMSRQDYPEIAHIGYTTAISWIQTTAGISELCVAFTDSINSGLPHEVDTIAEGNILDAHLAISHGAIFVVWEDASQGCVMMRSGTYINKNKAPQAVLNPIKLTPTSAFNVFIVNLNNVESVQAIDNIGRKYDVDFLNNEHNCRITAEDLEAGSYKIEITDENGKVYHSHIEVKEAN